MAAIDAIGREMVACTHPCAGIHRDQTLGSLPRCLVLETKDRAEGEGCVVVGINPGRASEREREYYRAKHASYASVVEWFAVVGYTHRYYTALRRIVTRLGLNGPILWTELAKCENAAGIGGLPPLETLRRCTGAYLARELAAVPADWPLIAVGGEAYKALAYMHPERTVIGVPHPTGSYGHFARLLANGDVRETVRAQALAALASRPGALTWLDGDCG